MIKYLYTLLLVIFAVRINHEAYAPTIAMTKNEHGKFAPYSMRFTELGPDDDQIADKPYELKLGDILYIEYFDSFDVCEIDKSMAGKVDIKISTINNKCKRTTFY